MSKIRSRLETKAERYYNLQEEIGVLRRTLADLLVKCFDKMTAGEKREYNRAVGHYEGGPQVPPHHPTNMRCIQKLSKGHQEMYRSIIEKVIKKQDEAAKLYVELAEGVKGLGKSGGKRRKTRGKKGRKGKRVSTRRRRH